MKPALLLAVMLFASTETHAADMLTPGLWEVTVSLEGIEGSAVTTDMKQALAKQAPKSVRQCLTAEQLKPTADQLAISSKGKCKSTSFSFANGTLASSAECSMDKAKMTSATTGTYSPTAYRFRSSNMLTTPKGVVTTKTLMAGTWISACPK
jgi:PBP1b-binding outer membrane lipoprotein LpoB